MLTPWIDEKHYSYSTIIGKNVETIQIVFLSLPSLSST